MFKAAFSGRSEKGSSTSQQKKSSRAESGVSTSSRKAEDEKSRPERSRGSTYDDDTAAYKDAPTSRNGERRALTESAVNLLNNDEEDEDWEDDEDKDARSEKRSVKSDGRRRRHKSEKERSRSRSRDGGGDRKSKSKRKASETSRGKPRALDEGEDRAIPDMGSFEQFPGQYAGGQMGDAGKQEFMMSGAISNSADNQFGLTRADTFGAAADYYQDEGQSVNAQPGYRAKSPNMLVNPDHHLMAATTDEQPAQDTGHGSAADFYGGKVSPVPYEDQPGKAGRQSSGSSKPSKGRTNSLGTSAATSAAIGAAGMALGAKTSQSQSQSQSQYQTSSSKPPRRPSRQNTEPIPSGSSSTYYAPPPQNVNPSGKQASTNSNAGLYAAGVAAAGAAGIAAYEMHEHHQHQQQQQQNGYAVSNSQYAGAQSSYGVQARPISNGNTMYSQSFHEHKGPMTRLKDGFLNLLASEEDVVKMEMYTEYIGVCKYCFDPRTSATDAPRVHHYHASSRNDSFEDLRKRRSIERMRRSSREGLSRTGSNRVDKDSRYYSNDVKRRKSTDKSTLVGAGLAAAGAAAGASMLLSDDRKDFDDTYSVKSGHRESSAVRRRSRSSSREMRRKASHGVIDADTKEEYVTVRTKDGRIEKRKVKQRSRSTSRERKGSLAATAAGAAIGASTVAAASSRHGRQRSPKRSRRSRSSSRDREQQGFFGSIFSPSRKEKKRRGSRTERRKKQSGFFNFGNGSVSSSDNDLAFGASRTDLSLRRKSSTKSMKKKSSDEHIAATVAGIGVTAAALAAAQNGRRVNQRNSGVELGARRDTKTTPITGPAVTASSEEEWVDEQELPSDVDDATSAEGDLAFGDYDRRKLSKRQSMESVGSQSSGGGFLGWKWGRKDKRSRRRPSRPVSSYSPRTDGPYIGSAPAAGAAAGAIGSKLSRNESAVTSTSSIPQRPMQEIDPRPMSETGSASVSRHASIPGAFDSYQPSVRPGPAPIQQPKPITPIKPSFTESPTEFDARDASRPIPRRTQSSPVQNGNFMQDAALIGAAAIGTAGIIAATGRKSKEPSNVRFGFTEEQERKHERELQREREKSAEEARQRDDRERKLKDEAARYTREQDVLRAREAENRKVAEAKLERERAAQREAEEQAEEYRRREREHQEREDAFNRERIRREEEDRRREEDRRQRERDEIDRRRREKEEDERRQQEQYETERRQRERDDADRQQREIERQREYEDRERYSRERDQARYRPIQERQDYDRRETDDSKESSVSWGGVAAGAAAASVGAYAVHEYNQRTDRDQEEQREYRSRDDRRERRDSYRVQEVKPPEERRSNEDDDFYNPENYRRGTRQQSDYARHVELARKAASKVVAADQVIAENEAAYSSRSQSQAEFFAPEEIRAKTPEGKEKASDPMGDSQFNAVKTPDEEHRESFKREWAVAPQPRSRYAPYGVPKLDLVSPTPPPSARAFGRRRSTEPTSRAPSGLEETEAASDVAKSAPRRSISWGVDQTHVYDAPTPEAEHDAESYVGHHDVSTAVAATSAAVAVVAGAAAVQNTDQAADGQDRKTAVRDAMTEAANVKTKSPAFYEQPYYESVSDIGLPKTTAQTPSTEGAPPVRGFVEGEVGDAPIEEQRHPHIPGGFDDDEYDVEQPTAPTSSDCQPREDSSVVQRDLQSADKDRDVTAKSSQTEPVEDIADDRLVEEEPQRKPPLERKLSKKEKRKLEKAAKRGETVEDEQPSVPSALEERKLEENIGYTEGERQRDDASKKSSFADIAGAVMTTGGVAAVAAASNAGDDEPSTPKKNSKKKDKKGKKSRENDRDKRNAEPPDDTPADEPEVESAAMPGSWDASTKEQEDELPAEVVDPFQYQVHDDPEDYQPSYPLTAKAPPVTSVQETNAKPRTSSISRERDVEMNGHNDAEDLVRSQNRTSQGMADVASAIYEQSRMRSSQNDFEDVQDESKTGHTAPVAERTAATESLVERDSRPADETDSRTKGGYYEEPDTYDDARSTTMSDRRDEYGSSRKSKRRSRGPEDDTISITSSGSRRSKDSPDSSKKDKKGGFFGGMFGRKSAQSGDSRRSDGEVLSRQSTKESRDEDGEDAERRRRRRRHTESEYGDEDDSRSVTSESRRKHHHRRRTDEDEYSSTGRKDEGEERAHHHHHRRSTNDDEYDREQSFLEIGVEGMPPLPANQSESETSAPVKEERDSGMPASAEPDTELESRDHAAAFELIRQDQHERSAANAFDLIRQGQNERPAEDAFDLVRHEQHDHEPIDVGMAGPEESQEYEVLGPKDVAMDDGAVEFGSSPASPTAVTEAGTSGRRLSLNRPVSSTAVPLRFPFGPPTSSPRVDRSTSFGGSIPTSPATPMSASSRTRQGRPTSTEIRPLYLVERNRKIEDVDATLPSLPSSKTTSRASSQVGSDEYESAEEESSSHVTRKPLSIDVDRATSFEPEEDYLDSQQTTPKASEPPRPIFEKPARQEPQFYTWEDFARSEERMRNAERGEEAPADTDAANEGAEVQRSTSGPNTAEDPPHSDELPALPPSRPESRIADEGFDGFATGTIAAAALGGAALLAHHASEEDDPQDETRDVRLDDTSGDTSSRDFVDFVDSERLMEAGEIPGSPRPIYVAPSPDPNDLDLFLDAEEQMEEGGMEAESTSWHETADEGFPMDRDFPETIDEYMDSEVRMEAEHAESTDRNIEPVVEPPTLMTSVGGSSSAAEQAVAPEHAQAFDSEAPSAVEALTPARGVSAPTLTRKQSKKAKKKQKAASSQAIDDDDFARIEDLPDTSMTDAGTSEKAAVGSATVGDQDRAALAEARRDTQYVEESQPEEASTREGLLPQQEELDQTVPSVPEAERQESAEEMSFLSRKKGKRDKKKDRQQAKENKKSSRKASTPAPDETPADASTEAFLDDSIDVSEKSPAHAREENSEMAGVASSAEKPVSVEKTENIEESMVPRSVDDTMLDIKSAPGGLEQDETVLPPPSDAEVLPQLDDVTIDPGTEASDARTGLEVANDAVDEQSVLEDEPVDEFTWTSGSKKKKGKQAKKSKQSSKRSSATQGLPEPTTAQDSGEPDQGIAILEATLPGAVPAQIDAGLDNETEDQREVRGFVTSEHEVGENDVQEQETVDLDSQRESQHESRFIADNVVVIHDSSTADRPPFAEPATMKDISAANAVPKDRELTEELHDDHMPLEQEPLPTTASMSLAEQDLQQDSEPTPANASDEHSETLSKATEESMSRGQMGESMSHAFDQATEDGDPTRNTQTNFENPDLAAESVDLAPAAEEPEFLWTQTPKKKGKKGKKSKKAVEEETPQEEAVVAVEPDLGNDEQPSAADSTPAGEASKQTTDMEDVQYWTAPSKGKKSKKDKKHKGFVAFDTADAEEASEQRESLKDFGSANESVIGEADATEPQAVEAEPGDFWTATSKGKKGKKDKKSKQFGAFNIADERDAPKQREPLNDASGTNESAIVEAEPPETHDVEAEPDESWAIPVKSKKAKKSKRSRMAIEESSNVPQDDVDMADNLEEPSEQRETPVDESAFQPKEVIGAVNDNKDRSIDNALLLDGSMEADVASLTPLPEGDFREERKAEHGSTIEPSADHHANDTSPVERAAEVTVEDAHPEIAQPTALQPAIIEEMEHIEESNDGQVPTSEVVDMTAEPLEDDEEAKVLDEGHPTTMEPEQMAPDEEPDRLEPEPSASPDVSIPFVPKKSKKDKKKGKKSRASTTDDWADEDFRAPVEAEAVAEDPAVQQAPETVRESAAVDIPSIETKEDEQDWGSFSTERSKKDKKKDKKSRASTTDQWADEETAIPAAADMDDAAVQETSETVQEPPVTDAPAVQSKEEEQEWGSFSTKRSKKDKKKDKKSRAFTTDYWVDEEDKASIEPVVEESTVQQVDAASEKPADIDTVPTEIQADDETKDEEQDWGSFSAKRSKKDKKKDKKSRGSTTDYWPDEEDKASIKPLAEFSNTQQADVAAEKIAIVDTPPIEDQGADGNKDEEQDWGAFSTKRSKKDKKDKKKDKKRPSMPAPNVSSTVANETEPTLESLNSDLKELTDPMDVDQPFGVSEATPGPEFDQSQHVHHKNSPPADAAEAGSKEPRSIEEHAPGLEEVLAEENEPPSTLANEDGEMRNHPDVNHERVAALEPSNQTSDPTLANLITEYRPYDRLGEADDADEPTIQETRAIDNEKPVPESVGNTLVPAQEPDAQRDIDFTATVAAGLADSGFDADLVVNDPAFQRRGSPPGTVAEADPEELFTSYTQKRKKGKKGKRESEMEDVLSREQTNEASSSLTPKSQQDDLNETLAQTLAASGFDTALAQRATSGDDTPSNEITGDSMFSFSTSKRKKGKKSKTKDVDTVVPDEPEIRNAAIDDAQVEATDKTAISGADNTDRDLDADANDVAPREDAGPEAELDLQREETNATDEPESAANVPSDVRSTREEHFDPQANLILASEEMDVDEMDSAYRTFKRKKRDKKKQKATSSKVTNKSQLESVSETERRERDIVPRDTSLERERSQTPRPVSSTPMAPASDDRELDGGHARSLRSSDVQAEQQSADDREAAYNRETGRSGQMAFNDYADSSTSWSFANLDKESPSNPESPVLDEGQRTLVRDSGYQTADSPLVQRRSVDSSTFNAPEIRTPQSRESLHERRSGEPLRITSETSHDWNLHPSKTRDILENVSSETLHARTPSQATTETPLESTTKNRASYLFQSTPENLNEASTFEDSPTPRPRISSIDEVRNAFSDLSPQATRESALDSEEDRVLSPASGVSGNQRSPLDTIPEERQGQKRTIAESGLVEAGPVEPDSAKATRRSETPRSPRSRERAFSPASLPSVTIPGGHGRSVSGPSSSDHLAGRALWSSTDGSREPEISDRTGKRKTSRQASSDIRSPSVMSNRSNTSAGQFRSPEELRSYSRASNASTTPSLRRVSLSGDLRAASRRGESGSAVGARASPKTIPFEAPPTPPPNDDEVMDTGASRSIDMSDVYSGYGDADASQVSPTRPPNMRKRQSMHIMELESKVDQLVAENEALQDARRNRGFSGSDVGTEEDINLSLREKDNEIRSVRTMLQSMQAEISRLNEINAGLSEANRSMVDDNNGQFAALQAEHAHAREQWENTSRELDDVRQEHGRLTSGMREVVEAEIATALADKNSEIRQLREELDVATERIRALQVQIQTTRSRDFLTVRDEDYFDGACQKLCQHVQQWVLRFSKLSDDRRCRLSTDLNDDKIELRLDNVVLDGSDVDKLLSDRIKRRDVFMSLVMTMIWEYVFTRYLFGMDREQRKKLKDLEKMLEEVGPKRAVSQWRATTLTLLSQRPAHATQRDLDTDAVAQEIFSLLCRLLPPPSSGESQLMSSLSKVIRIAVDLSIDMRCQRAEYIMLPPLQPEYDTNGDLVQKVYFNASLMNERSGTFSSNGELEQSQAVVKIVLFPLVVKKGDEVGEGEEEIVVCPAQVLVHSDSNRSGKRIVRVQSGAMEIDDPRRSQKSLVSPGGSMAF